MNELSHFDIHCDDVQRAQRFYETVFGWNCVGYGGQGPQDFMRVPRVLMRRAAIRSVGWISKFLDTEGNLFCAVQYDRSAQ